MSPSQHDSPRAFEFPGVAFYLLLAALSAAICTQINVRLGITPNTAVVGVVAAMALGRKVFPYFASPERQVLVETATSAGGFAGANIALVSLGILYLLGLSRLVFPLLVGITTGMLADIWLAYRLFGTTAFPAHAAWPDGEAVGQVIMAGDEGGARARRLLQGVAAGAIGRLLQLPMAGVGIAFIGNPWALGALGIGLVLRGWVGRLLHFDWEHSYVPQGIMIGAALAQVGQTLLLLRGPAAQAKMPPQVSNTRHNTPIGSGLHLGVFLVCAAAMMALGRLDRTMPSAQLLLWLGFAAVAAWLHTLIVGYCAMLSGWFPSFAVGVALLLVGLTMRFPLPALALLAGFILSTGPQFADLGYDLKSGWLVRGKGRDGAREAAGRFQQFLLQQVGAGVGIAIAAAVASFYFRASLIPPMSRVFAATASLVMDPAGTKTLALASVGGGALQLIGGPGRALGILFATGLLLVNPIYGVGLLVALVVRRLVEPDFMAIRAPGLIAGDGLFSFLEALLRML